MGRIRNRAIKRSGVDLISLHKGKFSTNFEENKKALTETADIESKKIRNVLAGYITKLMKRKQ
nr:30S ribosomal protein S17e [Candidatus Woesearchaeota archaeon]